MDLLDSLKISAAGMKAQAVRLRTIAENIANANSTADTPGGDPYRRKISTFRAVLDRALGLELVQANKPVYDKSEFELRFDPQNRPPTTRATSRCPTSRP